MDWTTMLTPSIGSAGLLAVVVVMILTGRLVPRSNLDDLRADKDAQIATWKTAYEKAVSVQDVQREHVAALLDAARTTTHVIQALPHAAHLDEQGGRRALAETQE